MPAATVRMRVEEAGLPCFRSGEEERKCTREIVLLKFGDTLQLHNPQRTFDLKICCLGLGNLWLSPACCRSSTGSKRDLPARTKHTAQLDFKVPQNHEEENRKTDKNNFVLHFRFVLQTKATDCGRLVTRPSHLMAMIWSREW